MKASHVCSLVALCVVGCTDFSHHQGTRISDQNILEGRPFAQGGSVEALGEFTSTNAFLKPLETSVNEHISFKLNMLGLSGPILRAATQDFPDWARPIATWVEEDGRHAVPVDDGFTNPFNQFTTDQLLTDLAAFCALPSFRRTCRDLPDVADLQEQMEDTKKYFDILRFELQPDVAMTWDDNATLNTRLHLKVSQSQTGIDSAAIDVDWSKLIVDLKMRPSPCGFCSEDHCTLEPGVIYQPDAASTRDTHDVRRLNVSISSEQVSSDHSADIDAGCAAVIWLPNFAADCIIGQVQAQNGLDSAAEGISEGVGQMMSAFVEMPRLFAPLPTNNQFQMNLQMQVFNLLCNPLSPAAGSPLCTAGSPGDLGPLLLLFSRRGIDLGQATVLINGDTTPVQLGARGGVWTDNSFRALIRGAAVQTVTLDLQWLRDIDRDYQRRCVASVQEDWTRECEYLNDRCYTGDPDQDCVLFRTAPPFPPIALATLNLGTAVPTALPAMPALGRFLQVGPAMAAGVRDIFGGPLQNGRHYTHIFGDPGSATFEISGNDDPDQDCISGNFDNCPNVFNTPQLHSNSSSPQLDEDNDDIGDACDSCPGSEGGADDSDRDGIGDDCDCDRDGDGCNNEGVGTDTPGGTPDICPSNGIRAGYFDEAPDVRSRVSEGYCASVEDRFPSHCTDDDDGDGVLENITCGPEQEFCFRDNCPLNCNPDQADQNFGSNINVGGDACDRSCGPLARKPFVACTESDLIDFNDRYAEWEMVRALRYSTIRGMTRLNIGFESPPRVRVIGPGGFPIPINTGYVFTCNPRFCNPSPVDNYIQAFAIDHVLWQKTPADFALLDPFNKAPISIRDLDLDGQDDLLVGVTQARSCADAGAANDQPGQLLALSSRTGAELYRATNGDTCSEFGASYAILGDRLLVGAPEARNPAGLRTGAVHIMDVTGPAPRIIKTVYGEREGERFGEAIAIAPAQSSPLFYVGAPDSDPNYLEDAGRIYAVDIGGQTQTAWDGPLAGGHLGARFAVTPPQPASALPSLIVAGLPNAYGGRGAAVSFMLDTRIARVVQGGELQGRFGEAIVAHDFDGDGGFEVAIGEPGAQAGDGRIAVYTPDLLPLTDMAGGFGGGFGSELTAPGDINGDGIEDLGVSWEAVEGEWLTLNRSSSFPPPNCGGPCPAPGACVPGEDLDGDGAEDCSETDGWNSAGAFNGMHVRQAARCHASPSCQAIDTRAEVDACVAQQPVLEERNQYAGWDFDAASQTITDPGYGFQPNWSVATSAFQADWSGRIKLDADGYHCFAIAGNASGGCASLFFQDERDRPAQTGGETRCYHTTAGSYPIRWFFEAGSGAASMHVNYCFGAGAACAPTQAIPASMLRPALFNACTPRTCASAGAECGQIEDGCGGTLDCDLQAGGCSGLESCGGGGEANVCGCPGKACTAPGADSDGDGFTDATEVDDPTSFVNGFFNGARVRRAHHCHDVPQCSQIDQLAEVEACTAGASDEQLDQHASWNFSTSSNDLSDPSYGFAPNWTQSQTNFQIDARARMLIEQDGTHCFAVTGFGDDRNQCASLFFHTATTGAVTNGPAQCFQLRSGLYAIRWFYEMADAGQQALQIRYCFGGSSACTPVNVLPSTSLILPDALTTLPNTLGTTPDEHCRFELYNAHNYFFCDDARDWAAAEQRCENTGGTLVHIDDAMENDYVLSRLAGDSWIGATDDSVEGQWRWRDDGTQFWNGGPAGAPVGGRYNAWLAGQPDESGAQDCAAMGRAGGRWLDEACSTARSYVCEAVYDQCPSDPAKLRAGQCGCGVSDADSDADGTADCHDGCPEDFDKLEPGICGCDETDLDSDGDGLADCEEICDFDPDNVELPVFAQVPANVVLNDCSLPNDIGAATAFDGCTELSVPVLPSASGIAFTAVGSGFQGTSTGPGAPPGGGFPRGLTSVTWTATDDRNHVITAPQSVTVSDTTPPQNLVAPPPLVLTTQTLQSLADLDPGNLRSAVDACGGAITWRTVPAPAGVDASTQSIEWYATDADGNESSVPAIQPVIHLHGDGGWAGRSFSCTLTATAQVQCWGDNSDGQLGDGTYTERWAPAYVTNLPIAQQLSVGHEHACVVVPGGTVQCWGKGLNGRLGNNSIFDSNVPVTVSGLTNAAVVSAGGDDLGGHSCALSNTGQVHCWGWNLNGQLGNNSLIDRLTPVLAQFPAGTVVTQLSVGGQHSCAVDSLGRGWCWGEGINGQLGNGLVLNRLAPTQVSMPPDVAFSTISAGDEHTCAVDTAGRTWCWGRNLEGQLGNNSIINRLTPVQVTTLGTAKQVAAGVKHTCAVLASKQVFCWGEGNSGRLGNGSNLNRLTPVQVSGVTTALQVSAGDTHTCARVIDGTAQRDLCWGGNSRGQLGNGTSSDTNVQVMVAKLCSPTSVSAGDAFTCSIAAHAGGTALFDWGLNTSSQLGNGSTASRRASAVVANTTNISSVACGSIHGCAVIAGQARCWGNNGSGRLGDGTTTNRTVPTAVSGSVTYSMVATGDAHSCGIVTDGAIRCWGSGGNGRLGNGSTANKLVPTAVTGLPGAASWITTGDAHSCAVVANGASREVWCWGTGASGRLGNGGSSDATTPVRATGITTALTVSAGAQHTCATTTSGSAYCWGNGGNGRLGNGASANSTVPVQVQNSSGAPLVISGPSVIATGDDFSCVTGVGSLLQLACWGNNALGALGDGSGTSSNRARLVPGAFNATTVSAGDTHVCSVLSGQAFCWGVNADGRLGDGTTINRGTPRLVAVQECN